MARFGWVVFSNHGLTRGHAARLRPVDSWRRALNLYVYGLRDQSSQEVLDAFNSIGDAEKNEWQSRVLLQQLERQRDSAPDGLATR